MVRFCLHCHRQLDFVPSLRGELFCSPEHREFYFAGQIALNYDGGGGRPEVTIDPVILNELTESQSGAINRIRQSLTAPEAPSAMPPVAPFLRTPAGNQPIAPALPAIERAFCEVDSPVCRPVFPRSRDIGAMPTPAADELILIPAPPPRSIRPWVVSGIAAMMMLAALILGTYPHPSRPARGITKAEPEGIVHAATLASPAVSEVASVAHPEAKPLAFHVLASSESPTFPATKPEPILLPPPSLFDLIPNEDALESTRLATMASGIRHASIEVTTTSWVSACSDGKEVLRRFLSPGEMREIEFADRALLRLGNAAGVRVAVEGRPISLGLSRLSGALRVIELGPRGSRLLALPPDDDGTRDCAENHPRFAWR